MQVNVILSFFLLSRKTARRFVGNIRGTCLKMEMFITTGGSISRWHVAQMFDLTRRVPVPSVDVSTTTSNRIRSYFDLLCSSGFTVKYKIFDSFLFSFFFFFFCFVLIKRSIGLLSMGSQPFDSRSKFLYGFCSSREREKDRQREKEKKKKVRRESKQNGIQTAGWKQPSSSPNPLSSVLWIPLASKSNRLGMPAFERSFRKPRKFTDVRWNA